MMSAIDFIQRVGSFFSGLVNSESRKRYTLQDVLTKASSSFFIEKKMADRMQVFVPRFDSFIKEFIEEEEVTHSCHPSGPSLLWDICFIEAENIISEARRWEPEASDTQVFLMVGAWAGLLYAILLHNLEIEGLALKACEERKCLPL